MNRTAYWGIARKSMEPEARERSIRYLAEHLGKFLKKGERVLICFLEHTEGSLSWLMEQAVLRCDAVPVIWGPDHHWKTLLRQAFYSKASAIIGPPLIVLGLAKLAKYNGMPLSVRRVVTAGYPCGRWMIDGIQKGLDCKTGGCFTMGESGAVAGFACGHSWGVHLREAEYGVDIVDTQGNVLPEGEVGEIVLYPRCDPTLRYCLGENARLDTSPCKCGSRTPRLLDMAVGRKQDPDVAALSQYLQSWTSVLDCRIVKGPHGLEIEIVCFQGEKLPKLPTAAKLVIRPWDPRHDEPFDYEPPLKVAEKM